MSRDSLISHLHSEALEPTFTSSYAYAPPSDEFKCSALSANVVWLDTDRQYVVTQSHESCVNGKYVLINHVCWVEMGPYTFPPLDSGIESIPAGNEGDDMMNKMVLLPPMQLCKTN